MIYRCCCDTGHYSTINADNHIFLDILDQAYLRLADFLDLS